MTHPSLFTFPFKALGSRCEIKFYCENEHDANRFLALALQELGRIEQKYSRYLPDSLISQLNQTACKEWFEVDDETLSLFQYADKLYDLSGGTFDITSGIFRRVWDFDKAVIPSSEAIEHVKKNIGWPLVARKGKTVKFLAADMEIDLGGFGKEYAADRVADVLKNECHIKSGLVNLGGDIKVIGPKLDGEPWQLGIQDPRALDKLIATIPLIHGGLATSGDYERYFEHDHKRYCHIINPKTGIPVSYWRSITIIAPLAVVAGSVATIAMLKEALAIEFLDKQDFAYLAIDNQGRLFQKQHTNV